MNNAGTAMLVGMLMLVGTTTLDGNQSSPRVGMLEQEGWRAIKAGNYKAAVDAFGEATRLEPKNAELWLGAGTAEFLLRHDPEARAHLLHAIDLDPKLTIARAQLAQVVKRQGDLTERSASTKSSPATCLTMPVCAIRSIAGSGKRICMNACGSRSAITSRCRSKARRMRRWRRRRFNR
jgi:tetratricopeptide (TPR) repeat protein